VSTFVTVGNATQPFDRLLSAVAAITASLPQPVIVQRGAGTVIHPLWDTREFVPMEVFRHYVAHAELLIMHGGAGSIIEALTARRMPIVMPRRAHYGEILDDHQVELTRALSDAGEIVLVMESGELARAITAVDPEPAPHKSNATALVEHLTKLFEEWASGRPGPE